MEPSEARDRALGRSFFGLPFGYLRDVENVDVHSRLEELVLPDAYPALVVVSRDDEGRIHREIGYAAKHVLRARGAEVGDELVVDGQVRREDEEVVDAPLEVEPCDESPHEPSLADARGQGEAERGEVALEVGHLREFAPNRGKLIVGSRVFGWRRDLADSGEYFQGTSLGLAEGKAAGDAVHGTISHVVSPE